MFKVLLHEIASLALEPLLGLAAAAFAWACHRGARWLSAKAKNETVKGVIDRLAEAVSTSVLEIEQTIAKTIKAQTTNGKLSADAATVIKAAAIESVKAHLGPDAIVEAQKVLGVDNIESVIASRIEAAIAATRSK